MNDGRVTTTLMDRLVAEVADHVRSGASLEEIEGDVIDNADLDGDHKAALWLYAWSADGAEDHEPLIA